MTHYLLLKLKRPEEISSFIESARPIMDDLVSAGIGVTHVAFEVNASTRAENMDLLIVMEMENQGVLEAYLPSELHQRFIRFAGPQVESKVTFDRQ